MITATVSQANKKHDYRLMIVFGDSLVDSGNLPPILFLTPEGIPGLVSPPPTRYDRGRFSNELNIADYLANELGTTLKLSNTGFGSLDSINFAHGGASTYESNLNPAGIIVPGVLGQVSQFLGALDISSQIDPRTLILIIAGADDYIFGLLRPTIFPQPIPTVIVDNLYNAIDQLYARGGREFIVLNLPDLGKIPLSMQRS